MKKQTKDIKYYLAKNIKYLVLACIIVVTLVYGTLSPRSYDRAGEVAPQAAAPDFMGTLKIITFDAGLLDIRVLGQTLYQPTGFIEQRVRAIPAALLERDADIIALQEIYEKEHIDLLIEKLGSEYPYYFFKHNSYIKLNNGLMIFSKYPFLSTHAQSQNKQGSVDEWLITDRGVLSAVVKITDDIQLDVVNLHATSGGALSAQDDANITQARQAQLKQAIELAIQSQEPKQIILGDINAGPNVSSFNYSYLLESGFHDAYAEFAESQNQLAQPSWSLSNPLNTINNKNRTRDQRIDHIFLSDYLAEKSKVIKVERIFDESVVKVGEQNVPLSDHYGIEIALQFPLSERQNE